MSLTPSLHFGRKLDYLAEGRRPWILLLLLALAMFLPGLATIPPVDRDEARYVQATRQMMETGDFLRIRYQDEARNKKPVGAYWVQAAFAGTLGTPSAPVIWPFRLASLTGATAAVLLTFFFGAIIVERRAALIGAMMLATCLDLVFEAHVATTDAIQLPFAVAAQGALASGYLAVRRGERISTPMALVFWAAQGLAILVKGPVVPFISLLTALSLAAFDKGAAARRFGWLKTLRPGWGFLLTAVLVLPWLVAIEWVTHGDFLAQSVGHDLLGKVAGAQETHGAPPGYYLALLPVTFWPGTLFLGLGAVWSWRNRRLAAARLLLAWILPFWLVLELVPTKLPHYVLPLYPAVALVCARGLLAASEDGLFVPKLARWLPAGLWAAIGLALAAALTAGPIYLDGGAQVASAVALVGMIATGTHVLIRERARFSPATAVALALSALLVLTPGFGSVLPGLRAPWLSRSAAALVASQRALDADRNGSGTAEDAVASGGYAEPSLVFLLGTETRLLTGGDAGAALAEGQVALALVADGQEGDFQAAVAARRQRVQPCGSVRGFDYSNGRWMVLTLYRLEPKP